MHISSVLEIFDRMTLCSVMMVMMMMMQYLAFVMFKNVYPLSRLCSNKVHLVGINVEKH